MFSAKAHGRSPIFLFLAIFLLGQVIFPIFGQAEVVLDSTIKPAVPLAGPDYRVFEEMGQRSGNNLFHSFSSFSLTKQESVTFSGSASITRIISRVTGGQPSRIDGLIRSEIPGADFFFINPSGLLFGPHASLNLSGSLLISTAETIHFEDGGRFEALSQAASENTLFSAAPPSAFGFLSESPAGISLKGSSLKAAKGENLCLVAGDILVEKASSLKAKEGSLQLVSLASPGQVSLLGNELAAVSPGNSLGNISILDKSALAISGSSGGKIYIRAGQMILEQSFLLVKSNEEGLPAGLDLCLTEKLTVTKGGYISAMSEEAGNGPDLLIKAKNMEITEGGAITLSPSGLGDGGSLSLEIGESLLITEGMIATINSGSGQGSNLFIQAHTLSLTEGGRISGQVDALGSGGSISLSLEQLFIQEGGRITSLVLGDGQGAHLNLKVKEDVVISGPKSKISSITSGAGDAGGICLEAANLIITEGAKILGSTGGSGRGSTISLKVGSLELSSSGFIDSSSFADGQGGDIIIEAADSVVLHSYQESSDDLSLTSITSLACGSGQAGKIEITTPILHMFDEGLISATTLAEGRAGDIHLKVGLFLLVDSYLEASSQGTGRAGDITITAAQALSMSGPFTFLASSAYSSGQGGEICLFTPELTLEDGAGIVAKTEGSGSAGKISLAVERAFLTKGGFITTNTHGEGEGGTLTALASEFISISGSDQLGYGSGLLSKAKDTGAGGNILVKTPLLTLAEGGEIDASSSGDGQGGLIRIEVDRLDLGPGAKIKASSTGLGEAGDIHIQAKDLFTACSASLTTEADKADGGNIKVSSGYLIKLTDSPLCATVRGGLGHGGNIELTSPLLILNHSSVTAEAEYGSGGNINLKTHLTLVSTDSRVSASSRLGIDGKVDIEGLGQEVTSGLTLLPSSFLRDELLPRSCLEPGEQEESSFLILGRDQIPEGPGQVLY